MSLSLYEFALYEFEYYMSLSIMRIWALYEFVLYEITCDRLEYPGILYFGQSVLYFGQSKKVYLYA